MRSAMVLKFSYLNFVMLRCLFTFLKSKTRRNFFPSATVRGFTQCGIYDTCSMHFESKSCSIESSTNFAFLRLDLLFRSMAGGGYCLKGRKYPNLIMFNTNSDAFRVSCQNCAQLLIFPAVNSFCPSSKSHVFSSKNNMKEIFC